MNIYPSLRCFLWCVVRLSFFFLVLGQLAWAARIDGAESRSNPGLVGQRRLGGVVVAGHAWTWGRGTVFDAIDATQAAGCDALEVFLMGMTLSTATGDLVLDERTPDDAIAQLRAKCRATGVRIVNAYIGQAQWKNISNDEAGRARSR